MMSYFIGRKAYSTATENHGHEGDSKLGRSAVQQIQLTSPLRFSQKLVDEEQGRRDTSGSVKAVPDRLARPQNPRKHGKYAISLEPKKLEIVQTRSYPDREPYPESEKERHEMVILSLQNAEATEKFDDDFSEIRWM
jgi:hypothetical protein